ncbi:MAG TPA: large conductance mechanosensitive channel protein MscL [Nocardioidaceae bacterium]|nr:large conductance mechanosensitive channel protein MscL [Nocardioidaceae bacterium]
MLQGFKQFIMRGNLVELAVAFIIGGAFATVVTTFTAVILSLIAKVTGGKNPDMTSFTPGDVPVGAFITAAIAFLILAAVVYFFVVTPYNALQARMSRGEEAAPAAPDIALLTEIRDLLANRPGSTSVEGGGGLT